MPTEWFLALRFLREGRSQTALIITGVGVGVGVIVFLTALISGLQANLIAQTLGSQAHIVVRPPEEVARPQLDPAPAAGLTVLSRVERRPQRVRSIVRWQQELRAVSQLPGVVAVAPVVSGPAFATRGTASRAVLVRGSDLDQLEPILPVRRRLVAGHAPPVGAEALVGAQLATDLGLGVGDRVRLGLDADSGEVFTVVGVFDLGNKDVNGRWVLVPLRAAQTLHGVVGGATEIEVAVSQVFDAEAIAERVTAETGLVAESWMERNAQLLVGLRSQSSSSLMIQVFVILAVVMGIASVLIVSVVQRSREIGILRAMGTSRARVLRVFLIQGGIVGGVGAVLGSALGGALAKFFETLARNADGSPTFPVQLDAALFLRTAALAVLIGIVAAALPARRAARLDPAVAIRHD
ncbi:MAG: ABC transporter permease [Deltaproteobacteria bacterium]|nr:MAG: ABC transporter permease [Deltaproteobacteria bacterium]